MKALVVDDQDINREILSMMLEEFATVTTAGSGEEAINAVAEAIADNEPFDLICMDISMPTMRYHEAMQQIRALEEKAQIQRSITFMVTASSDPEDMVAALILGECDDYLPKPVMRQTFIELLRKHGLIKE
jgi:two-component system chemotaxis response regulator CheY